MSWRKLNGPERAIVERMLSVDPELWRKYSALLSSIRVAEMSDGGMGSLLFECRRDEKRSHKEAVAEGEFLDKDNVVVSVTLNVDQDDELFELDVWKVDFSHLISWPEPEQVTVRR